MTYVTDPTTVPSPGTLVLLCDDTYVSYVVVAPDYLDCPPGTFAIERRYGLEPTVYICFPTGRMRSGVLTHRLPTATRFAVDTVVRYRDDGTPTVMGVPGDKVSGTVAVMHGTYVARTWDDGR